jgi:hypothetical protein
MMSPPRIRCLIESVFKYEILQLQMHYPEKSILNSLPLAGSRGSGPNTCVGYQNNSPIACTFRSSDKAIKRDGVGVRQQLGKRKVGARHRLWRRKGARSYR